MSYRPNFKVLRNLLAIGVIAALTGCPLTAPPGGGNANVNYSLISNTQSLDFGTTIQELQITIRKSFSSRPMSPLKATTPQPWMSVELPATPISSGPDDPLTVTVRVNRALMNPGVNTGFLTLSSSGAVPVVIPVNAFQTLVANFVSVPATASVGQLIQFTDLSEVFEGTGPIVSWLWDFGDGTTSTLQNPTKVYAQTGTFDVSLTVSTSTTTNTLTELDFVNIIAPVGPTASFAVTPSSMMAVVDQVVAFADTSNLGTSATALYAWDFGDGTTSTLQNPTHAYSTTGAFTVSLTVTTIAGTSTTSAVVNIATSLPPQAVFTPSSTFVVQDQEIEFTNQSVQGSLPINTRTWNFGDGTTSTDLNPTHSYSNVGTFNVTLTLTTDTETVVSNIIQIQVVQRTALDDYLDNGDTTFLSTPVGAVTIPNLATATVIQMTSQQWRTAQDVYAIGSGAGRRQFAGNAQVTWQHNLTIYDPVILKGGEAPKDTAILWIDGGSNNGNLPGGDFALATLAFTTGMVVAELDQVPNQPIFFTDEVNNARSEDEIIAYTYDKFLNDTSDTEWPLLLPMVKSAVRGMDATQIFMQTQGRTINDFVITGASKRGWTTWLTAAGALDGRVKGIAPLVIDFLNARPSLRRHLQSYDGFSPAVEDYVDEGVFDRFATPQASILLGIVDPLSYNVRFRMPKFVVNGTRDEFFMPDSSEFYFSTLIGEKRILPVRNAGHDLSIQEPTPDPNDNPANIVGAEPLFAALGAFAESVALDEEIPNVTFAFSSDKASVTAIPDLPPGVTVESAILYQALDSTPTFRDFRQGLNGDPPTPFWTPTTLLDQPNGSYIATVAIPVSGWRAYFIQFTFSTGHIFGTEVRIVPTTLPFPDREFGDGGNDFTPPN